MGERIDAWSLRIIDNDMEMLMDHYNTRLTTAVPRICLLTEGFYPPAVGGQQKHAHDLAIQLIAHGLPLFVITRQTKPASAMVECVDGIEIIRVHPGGLLTGKGWFAIVPLLLFLTRTLALLVRMRNQYDVIITLGLKTLPIPAVLIASLFGKRCVIKPESPIELWQDISTQSLRAMGISDKSPGVILARRLRYKLIRKADRVVAITRQIYNQLIGIGVAPSRIELIPNGIDPALFTPVTSEQKLVLRRTLHLPVDKTLFIYTGRITVSKGIMSLVQAWQRLVPCHKDIHLVLVGSGAGCFDDCEAELKSLLNKHHLEDSISLTGAVDNVHAYLQASDAFVFPSHYEGFGLSIIEALSCELPAVVSNVGIATDLIRNDKTAVLIEPGSPDQLLAGMEWLLEHRDMWRDMGMAARTEVIARFSMDAVAQQYATMLKTMRPVRPPISRSRYNLGSK